MSDIEELIGRYLVLSQKSDSTLNIFVFHQRAGQALLPRLKIANNKLFSKGRIRILEIVKKNSFQTLRQNTNEIQSRPRLNSTSCGVAIHFIMGCFSNVSTSTNRIFSKNKLTRKNRKTNSSR